MLGCSTCYITDQYVRLLINILGWSICEAADQHIMLLLNMLSHWLT